MCLVWLLAFICPPLVPLLLGRGVGSAMVNSCLTLLGWVPGVIHAIMCIGEYNGTYRGGMFITYNINED